MTITTLTALTFGSTLVIRNETSLGTLVAFIAYMGGLFGPVQNLTGIYRVVRTASVSPGHIFLIRRTNWAMHQMQKN